ncbi:hypothetical protein ACHHYP_20761 [Achlya hypogyna]|uniref:Secreted protein n=1 Tax=Achlya hypogyna TaxID=1202772 RepID=A0A1V9YBH9_ACHHY|nr:hypothetical protein ACHHYP_20761 [Achlya hypogyna]
MCNGKTMEVKLAANRSGWYATSEAAASLSAASLPWKKASALMLSASNSGGPLDTFASTSTKCTSTYNSNPCDAQDLFDGKGNCGDVFLSSSTVRRATKGPCDVAATCSGTSG